MEYREYLPSPPLRHLVECFWTISSAGQPAPAEAGQVMPDGGVELVLNFADPVHRCSAGPADHDPLLSMVVGQLPRAYHLDYIGRVDLLGTRFQPFGAYPILGVPLHELAGQAIDLDAILDRFHRKVERELDEFSSTRARISALEQVLLKYLVNGPAPDWIAEAAVARIQAAAGQVTVSALMAELGVSGRQLERVFQRHVGVPPKLLCRVLRFRKAWERAGRDPSVNWAALAARCGFYDQAHLIREFRDFTGTSPTQLFPGITDPQPDADL
jgi:AraC-like DNA-binding protein